MSSRLTPHAHSRIDHAATQVHVPSSPNSFPCLRPVPLLADFMSVCHRLCSSPSTCRRSRGCIRRCRRRRQKPRFATGASMRLELLHCRLDGSAVFLMRSEPFSPTPRRPPGRATLKPRPMARGTPGILRGVSACCVLCPRRDLVVFVIRFCTALKSAI